MSFEMKRVTVGEAVEGMLPKLSPAHEPTIQAERAKIAAWLRKKASQRRAEVETEWLNLADSIERGDHETNADRLRG